MLLTKKKETIVIDTENLSEQALEKFPGAQALRMHISRVHTRAGIEGGHKGARNAGIRAHNKKIGVDPDREERLRNRRDYQHKLRERYYREGKDSKGQPRPVGWKPRRRRTKAVPPSSSAEYKRIYQREWYAKKKSADKARKASEAMKASWARRKARSRIPKKPVAKLKLNQNNEALLRAHQLRST